MLFYHNAYEEGKQGGLEILQRSIRIASSGSLRLESAPDQWALLFQGKSYPRRVTGAAFGGKFAADLSREQFNQLQSHP